MGTEINIYLIVLKGKDYLPFTRQGKAALQVLVNKVTEVMIDKQQMLASRSFKLQAELSKKYEKAKSELDEMKLPTSGVVAPKHNPDNPVDEY